MTGVKIYKTVILLNSKSSEVRGEKIRGRVKKSSKKEKKIILWNRFFRAILIIHFDFNLKSIEKIPLPKNLGRLYLAKC